MYLPIKIKSDDANEIHKKKKINDAAWMNEFYEFNWKYIGKCIT